MLVTLFKRLTAIFLMGEKQACFHGVRENHLPNIFSALEKNVDPGLKLVKYGDIRMKNSKSLLVTV